MQKIAFLGAGAMGARMAANLISGGYEVSAWNRSPARLEALCERGLAAAPTPAAAARGADVVISMLRDDDAARAVWLAPEHGAVAGLDAASIAVECSSTTPAWSHELAAAVAATGAAYLEAPVVGSRPQVEAGQLIHLAGGEFEVLRRVTAILKTGAAAIHHVGAVGMAMSLKLAVNALFANQAAVLGEILGVLSASGVDDRAALELLGKLPVTSPALKGIGMQIAARDYAPLFPIELVLKDLDYYLDLAARGGAASAQIGRVRDSFEKARLRDLGGANIAAIARLYL